MYQIGEVLIGLNPDSSLYPRRTYINYPDTFTIEDTFTIIHWIEVPGPRGGEEITVLWGDGCIDHVTTDIINDSAPKLVTKIKIPHHLRNFPDLSYGERATMITHIMPLIKHSFCAEKIPN